ncbi:His Kinase A (phospho-acceptor) domain-containing protein [Ruminococcus flavefaciens]|uniref:histidine kinase n=1 Tax=Ruminococcus flavefaciens TaxID=1265 RepID=A0A1H6JL45_RUMFL|nr:HAMP domain-containing sensor histidine kinase [Ruminococcus flavefaciens]SEH59896.1 His Kinase A (phospho-acceptor) domain-containing protein [Ruminococcus flavefaciens]
MDKIKKVGIKSSFIKYLAICFVVCVIGNWLIYALFDYLQRWYVNRHVNVFLPEYFSMDEYRLWNSLPDDMWLYDLLHYGRYIAVSFWSCLCIWFTVKTFYAAEVKKPIDTLLSASERILSDDLDFEVRTECKNEIGRLCESFENMRKNLYSSNYELWKSLEERKRLNSAFSHDLRTPITVLKGYTELVKKFDGRISPEKQADILSKMSVQVERLEHYTEKMSAAHKLEDIIPEEEAISYKELCDSFDEVGKLICGNEVFSMSANENEDILIYNDRELIMQVFENIVSNAERYKESEVSCIAEAEDDKLRIAISDDGEGFSEEALRKAWQPFYHGENEDEIEHFGLGLYICRLLCRKCGGDLYITNGEKGGGKVTAEFSVKKSESR